MRKLTLLLTMLFAVGTLSACSSTSSSPTGSTSSSATANGSASTVAQADEDDPLVCENYIPSGTRIARKVCVRQSEKDRMREQAQTITQENQRRAVIGSPTGND